ncbi:MAG TPA: hypothetical protein DIC36_06135 [Gammaproteobacteria bacterium]|nr:hypothetical protein [Gammaproteobacteria bacterium]
MTSRAFATCCLALLAVTEAAVASKIPDAAEENAIESPWLVVPIVSSDPKLGTSGGLMAAYMFRMDPASSVSMIGAQVLYTTTGSKVGGLFARTNFGENHHRLTAFYGGGKVKNQYEDFLGTGFPLQTEDQLKALAGRYLYRVKEHWFVGAQATNTNYTIVGEDALSGEILEQLGLTGFDSIGIGAVINYDTRNDQNSPSAGMIVDLNNIAYRKGLGGDVSFDVYRLGYKHYLPHGEANVFVWRLNNHWTSDAPPGGYATIQLRGYTSGQYLGRNMSSIEAEERFRLGERWGITLFTGVACLYGGDKGCGDSSNIYPTIGGGLFFMVKPKEGMVATLEYADGNGSNRGIYLRFGWGI